MAVPALVVEGPATIAVDHAICAVVLRRVPDVEHSVIERAGHMLALTHPAELTPALVAAVGRQAS